jgi:UDP-glucose 4-epimerase
MLLGGTGEHDLSMRIIVTGGSGKLGGTVVASLRGAGHTVVVFDRAAARGEGVPVDLTDAGQTLDAIAGVEEQHEGADALVHLAAIPAPGLFPDVVTFENNILSTHHVLQAARRAGIRRIVTASSETLLGLPMDEPPASLPVDEEVTLPNSTYSMSKHLEEQMAITFCRWDPMLSITAMRFSNVMVESDYAGFEAWQDDPTLRKWNAWGYIDARDAAEAVRLALEVRGPGFERYIIANADTVMRTPSAELAAAVFPGVPFTRPVEGRGTLLSIEKARRELGWEPAHSWLDARG